MGANTVQSITSSTTTQRLNHPARRRTGGHDPQFYKKRGGWPGAFTAEESDAGAGAAADADAEAGADLAELIGRDLRELPEKPLLVPSAAAACLHLLPHRLPPLSPRCPVLLEGGALVI